MPERLAVAPNVFRGHPSQQPCLPYLSNAYAGQLNPTQYAHSTPHTASAVDDAALQHAVLHTPPWATHQHPKRYELHHQQHQQELQHQCVRQQR